MKNKLLAKWAHLRDKGCESNWHGLGEFNNSGYDSKPCNKPSVATVWIFGNPYRACRWHIEPLDGIQDNPKNHFSALVFLSRWQRPVPKEA